MDAENTFMEGLNRLGGGDHSKDGQIKSLRLTPDIINAEDVDAALKWIGGVASTIESGIHEIAKFTGGLIRVGAFRSVVTTLDNRSPYALRLSNKSLDHGIWTKDREPPVTSRPTRSLFGVPNLKDLPQEQKARSNTKFRAMTDFPVMQVSLRIHQ
ncbi:hypothetical protein [Hydrocarboniphaga effusa]|jgi:hypothetical protein|uniref:hypothetical protein n=1 Tax=Hydrocarboniphaga effusa TaxID=243629 RepID=UPI003137DE3B